MAYPSQIRGFLKSKRALFIVAVFCFPPDSTKGNSVVVLNETSGEFQSPGYPDLDDDMHCTWKISAPPYHRITITFLDFDLEEIVFCKDEVEIHGGDVKGGPYRGTQLHQQSITSTSNTILVVLTSCSTSLTFDRRGIRASYSTEETTTRRTTSITTIVNGPFSSQRNQMFSNVVAATAEFSTRLLSSNNNSEQVSTKGSGKLIGALLAGLLAMVIFIIIIILIVKRRKGSPAKSTVGHGEANQEQDDLPTDVTEGAAVNNCQLEYDYVQGNELQNTKNFSVSSDNNRGEVATKVRSSRLQKKNPISNRPTSNDLCVYESNASNAYDVTEFDEEYSTVSCSNQQASHRVHDNDRQVETKDLDMSLDEGIVINTAYEPYLPHT